LHGPLVKLPEVLGGVENAVAEIAAQPFHILNDPFDVLGLFFRRIGIVETQVALAAKFLGVQPSNLSRLMSTLRLR